MAADQDLSGQRVLVVEDELMVAMGIEMILTDAACEVVGPVGRFDEAVDAARTGRFDVAVLDVNLRGTEVYPVADVLAARGIPFAFLTGYGRDTLPARFTGHDVLAKPFQKEALLHTISSLATHRPQ